MAPTFAAESRQLAHNLRSRWPWLVVGLLVAHAASQPWPMAQVAAVGVLAFFVVFLSMEDLKSQTLPNLLTLPMGLCGLGLSWAGAAPAAPYNAILGSVVGGVFFLLIALLSLYVLKKPGMGVGDIKLLAAGGAWTGITGLPLVLLIASVAALLYLVVARIGRGQPFPFGPFLAVGIWLAVMYQPQVWDMLFTLTLL